MAHFNGFAEFYRFYLNEHQDPRCRALHYLGSILVLLWVAVMALTGAWTLFWLLPLLGYGFAWFGHFAFEHNRPATFRYPLYSLISDWIMLKDWISGQLPAKLEQARLSQTRPD
ncbi:DUF962 domain-containing protein [Ferrimonas gelatinilytica]|uniref:DUF962 domain-containing protein n=1 Tax=Ferrimonas gelatinilytica TaxID=1255257 RepID=A0ABP9RZY8_9GAMM